MTVLDWLSTLISFNTISSNSNLELIHAIADWFLEYSIQPRLTTENNTSKKANLFATLPAVNGDTQGGIILSGHTDVVPVAGQAWDTDPFKAERRAGKVFGRGASDMKGFIAVVLALLPQFRELNLNFPVHFAFSYDEEVGCRGAPFMIADFQELNCQPKMCIVGEPTTMHPVIAHKGICVFRCQIRGKEAHSSLTPSGCNAIEYGAKLILFLRQLAEQFKQEPLDKAFDVPFSTLTTNVIHGGNAYNIIPDYCEFIFEFRHLPEHAAIVIKERIKGYITNDLLPQMQQDYTLASINLIELAEVPSFTADPEASLTKICQSITGHSTAKKVAYATEAGLFQAAAIPTIICGPGSIEQAHRANEFVTLSQLQECERFLLALLQQVNL